MSNSTARVLISVEYCLVFIRVLSQSFGSPTIPGRFNGNLVNDPKLIFNAPNHDNIFDIVAKMQASSRFPSEEAACRFAIGLKLMSEVILENKNTEFAAAIQPHVIDIMKIVKDK